MWSSWCCYGSVNLTIFNLGVTLALSPFSVHHFFQILFDLLSTKVAQQGSLL